MDSLYNKCGLNPAEIPEQGPDGMLGGKAMDYALMSHPSVLLEVLQLRMELQKKQIEVNRLEAELGSIQFTAESTLGRKTVDKLRLVQSENADLGLQVNNTQLVPIECQFRSLHRKLESLSHTVKKISQQKDALEQENKKFHEDISSLAELQAQVNLLKSKLSPPAVLPTPK
eukprot:GHVH01008598.1.p1 GENE.GHVH01008598.1~~GHVH01008598.1.p1  ORF type:complete len:172 (+),score=35.17 GHVH01008598.1:30-545(+)